MKVYTAPEATKKARVPRIRIDAACKSGALQATDLTPDSSRRSWRVVDEDLKSWVRAGCPVTPPPT